jgi:hypothetical protein
MQTITTMQTGSTMQQGTVIFKFDNASWMFGLGKDLNKVFFFILSGFFLIWGFVSKNVKNGPFER